MKRQKPIVGSLFTVPLPDGTFAVGQIVGREPDMMNSWTCAFTRRRLSSEQATSLTPIEESELIAVHFVTGDLIKRGAWEIRGVAPVTLSRRFFPFEHLRQTRWVGAKMIGSGIIQKFLAAFHGLRFWDEMKDPDYYRGLLLPGTPLPNDLKRKSA